MTDAVTPSRPSLVWFRDDLRTGDNPALAAAIAASRCTAAVYILETAPETLRKPGGAALWKLHGALEALAIDLAALNVPLILMRGDARRVVPDCMADVGADRVFWNRRYSPAAVAVDSAVKSDLRDRGAEVHSFNASLLIEPFAAKTKDGGYYKVFSPFCRAARAMDCDLAPLRAPKPAASWPKPPTFGETLEEWELLPTKPDWAGGLRATWAHGERAAKQRLSAFLDDGFGGYRDGRDIPDSAHVSMLSPHLRFGEIGPRQVRAAAAAAAERAGGARDKDFEAFERELYWRDFSHNLLFHADDLATKNFQEKFDAFPWRTDAKALQAWRRGRTGYPIVDAGMRQLWETGWMHNRVRMVVASFLTKHLVIDWREGEAWFWDTLVDADHASNPANWQWVAGSGADAAPYFRIFNPMTQGEKFDPDGAYVRRWVPELKDLPKKYVHAPWTAPDDMLKNAGIRLGETYPEPIVDHKTARERALAAFAETKTDD